MPTSNGKQQKATERRQKEKPIPFKMGSFSATIYVTTKTVGGIRYQVWRPAYHQPDGKRIIRDCGSLERAREILRDAGQAFGRAQPDALSFTPEERRDADAAMALLAPHSLSLYAAASRLTEALALLPSGLPLNAAVSDYVAAVGKLPTGVSLVEAVTDFAKRHPSSMPRKTVVEVVEEMVKDRRSAGCSGAHLRDLENRLGRFATAFQMPIMAVSAPMVRDYLRTLVRENGVPVTNRTLCNVQRVVTSLFHFARKQRFVTRELVDEISEIESPKMESVATVVFTPEQLRRILFAAPDDIRAAIAIGAFCGLRTAELARINWGDVTLSERVIIVGADKAKTAARRVVPISENCAAWLAPLVRAAGPVSPSPGDRAMNHRFAQIAAKVGVKWVRNGLRHSACSYRLAITHDPARVATEAGNSPAMIHRCYKALVSEIQGRAWFDIMPASHDANVMALPQAVAA